jgi:hypothetical protein
MPEAAFMRRSSSSLGRPMVVVGAYSPQTRGTPTGIHIGREAPRRKGFVIASTIRCKGAHAAIRLTDPKPTRGERRGTPLVHASKGHLRWIAGRSCRADAQRGRGFR